MTVISGSFFFTPSAIEEDIEAAYRICMELQQNGILKAHKSKTVTGETFIQYTIKPSGKESTVSVIEDNDSAAK